MKIAELASTMAQYVELRTKRLELDKQSQQLKAEEELLRGLVLKELVGRDKTLHEVPGFKAEIRMKAVAVVENWDHLYAHIKKTGEFDLLHKSVTLTAARERWEAGKEVPGISQQHETTCTISKVKP